MKAIFSSLVLLVCLAMPLARAAAAEVAVSAAASLTNAFTEVKETFERGNPGIKIVTNFASSNALLAQIESGAPVDVFASADQATMDKAAEKKLLLASSRRDFARNGLVLIVPAASTGKAAKAEDLTQAAYAKIAVGNPDSVPAGRYTREVLQARKLWDALMPKMVYGESVRQVLDYVSREEAQAGFVYSTDAQQGGGKVKVLETLSGKTPVLYPIALLQGSKNQGEAKKFVDFVLSAEGQAILAKYGFSAP